MLEIILESRCSFKEKIAACLISEESLLAGSLEPVAQISDNRFVDIFGYYLTPFILKLFPLMINAMSSLEIL